LKHSEGAKVSYPAGKVCRIFAKYAKNTIHKINILRFLRETVIAFSPSSKFIILLSSTTNRQPSTLQSQSSTIKHFMIKML